MAKVVATYAQWWQMEIVMNNLAEEANAGVRLELLPLMTVMEHNSDKFIILSCYLINHFTA